jgi:myo-inositol-1-phosphate synthase
VGSEVATRWYAEQALKAGVGFVNAIPVFIGREAEWQQRFAAEGLPIIGDDIESQVGATISPRVLTRLFADRGVRVDRTYQLDFGGNTDFLDMLERERLESKRISKTNAVTSMLDYELGEGNVHVGPSDHVPWLEDLKVCHYAWRAPPTVTCRSWSNSSWRSGTAPTRPASSPTPSAA